MIDRAAHDDDPTRQELRAALDLVRKSCQRHLLGVDADDNERELLVRSLDEIAALASRLRRPRNGHADARDNAPRPEDPKANEHGDGIAASIKADEGLTPPRTFAALEPSPMAPEAWVAPAAAPRPSQPSVWSGFYNKTLRERYDVLALMYPRLQRLKSETTTPPPPQSEPSGAIARLGELPVRTANLMIENCIGVLGIPLGLGLNFVIDGRELSVPMAVEEPSVVAAASSAAKLIASAGGGFTTATTGNVMTSQIQLVDTPDLPAAIAAITAHRDRLLQLANATLCPNMHKRGGGAVDLYCRVVSEEARAAGACADWYAPCTDELEIAAASAAARYLVVHVDVDVCEAMGANVVNTVAEGLADELCALTRSRCGLRILTNLCMQRRARAAFEIPVARLGWKGVSGDDVAARILEAYNFAAVDPYRAVTHNKGIMNGVDAVAVATGQDWRALEAAAHCYASRSGRYAALSHYELGTSTRDGSTRVLRGRLELPVAVGSKGGALQTHPGYAATHAILGQPSARELSAMLVSVGLAQNFAAVRAIAVTGIQRGHMALHARNIAVAAGAPSELVAEVCSYMLGRQSINAETAHEYLRAHALFAEMRSSGRGSTPPLSPQPVVPPSMFYVEIPVPRLDQTISVNIAFASVNKHPQYIAIRPQHDAATTPPPIQRQLLGDKGFNQLEKMFLFLASMRSIVVSPPASAAEASDADAEATTGGGETVSRANVALQNKLQLLSILINILLYRLMEVRPAVVGAFMARVLARGDSLSDLSDVHGLLADLPEPADDELLSTGLPLLLALCQVLQYHVEQDVPHALLRRRLATEQWQLLGAVVASFATPLPPPAAAVAPVTTKEEEDNDRATARRLEAFMAVHAKRWQATMLLLIDALALPSEAVTAARLDVLERIGEYMEWEGTVAHDLARHARALTERTPNVFGYWLELRGQPPVAPASAHVAAFEDAMAALSAPKWRRIVAERDALATRVFSLGAVERVTRLIRDVYADRQGRRPRKESF